MSNSEYPRKYWWLVLIVVPLLASALAATLPELLKPSQDRSSTQPPGVKTPSRPSSPSSSEPGISARPAEASLDLDHQPLSIADRPPSPAVPTTDEPPTSPPPTSLRPETVRASGIGFPPPQVVEPARKRALARRAAEVDALRHLAEQLAGALVESRTGTNMAVLTEDEVRVRASELVRLATVVEERLNPDGSVEITMEAPLRQKP